MLASCSLLSRTRTCQALAPFIALLVPSLLLSLSVSLLPPHLCYYLLLFLWHFALPLPLPRSSCKIVTYFCASLFSLRI